MQRSDFFLRTKLLPPRPVPELLERPRLTERLLANLGAPVTMVAADAGCGKTTLIADFIRGLSRPTVWYQLDHTDADPNVFLNYIARGIGDIVPGFGGAIFPYLAEASEEAARYPERAADLLLNEILDLVEQPFILVLDDYHHIGRETPVHQVIDRLLQYSSDLMHLIITTRELPPLAMMRWRTHSAAMLITRDDLLFTDEEVRELFRRTLGVELNDREIEGYRERTQGWITALQLVRQLADQEQHAGSRHASPDLNEMLQRSEKDIFDYFAEEVFARESSETQHLLLSLSLLESLPLDHCSRLFPDIRCSAALPELAQKNVFLTAAGTDGTEEEYRFHPLFRGFLRRRLRSEIGLAALAAERDRIARYFLDAGKWDTALPYLVDAENFEMAAEVLATRGGEWISAGAFSAYGRIAESIPADVLDRHPRSLLHLAESARLQGEAERSARLLGRAVKLFGKQKDAAGEAEALHTLASLERRKGDVARALELLERAEGLAAPDSETSMKCANTRGLCLIVQGRRAEAEQQFRMALALAEKFGTEHYIRLVTHNLALAPGFRGDFAEALRWFKRIFREGEPDNQLPQEAIGHLNVARLHLYLGEFEQAETHLGRSLELCQLYNLKFLRGEIFEAYGNFYRDKGDLAHAGEYYERAQLAYEEADIDISARELNEERAKYHLARGDLPTARALLDNLLREREKANNSIGVNTALLTLSRVDLAAGRTDGLAERLAAIREFFYQENNYYDEAVAAMAQAELYQALGEHGKTAEPVLRAIDLAARFDYEYWLRGEIRRYPEIFRNEDIFEKLPLDLREEIGAAAAAPIVAAEAAPGAALITDLTVKVLGHVDVYRDAEKPFAPDAWTTRRARDIFCCIATSKYRRAAKDVLIETFWPEEDPEAIEKNFHPTISHIRKALNSRQPFKQNFIIFRDGAYQLNPELAYFIDAEEFELAIAEAEKAKREKDAKALRGHLERAYDLYRGEFLAGAYERWAEERRYYYAEQFARVVSALAKLAFSEKRWNSAYKLAEQILTADPYREDMHRLVMKTLAAQGKPAAVKKQYERLAADLKDELGIEPAAETRRVYAELTSQKE
jgi:LuxR family maltose regulon positive regulatory protein